MPKATQTILEINLTALGHNYRYIQSQLKQPSRIMAVVKAFGYGSQDLAIAKELEKLDVALHEEQVARAMSLHPPNEIFILFCQFSEGLLKQR